MHYLRHKFSIFEASKMVTHKIKWPLCCNEFSSLGGKVNIFRHNRFYLVYQTISWFACKLTHLVTLYNGKYLQCRLSATIRCLSHPSAHVRALSTSVLRAILYADSLKASREKGDKNGIHGPAYQYLTVGIINWQTDIEKCLTWEAHSRIATGMPTQFLSIAAKELGCTVSIWN